MSDSDEDAYGPALPPSMKVDSSRGEGNVECGSMTKGPDEGRRRQSSSSDDNDTLLIRDESESGLESDSEDCYGPALPPSLKQSIVATESRTESAKVVRDVRTASVDSSARTEEEESSAVASSVMPVVNADSPQCSTDEEDTYGPALPPGFVKPVAGPALKGPTLPPGGLPASVSADSAHADPDDVSSEDDDVIGPRPPPSSADLGQYAADEVERRARAMKEKIDAKNRPAELVREEWMLELPPERAGEFGLGPRQFRRSAAPKRGDTSDWTDTPEQREKRKAGLLPAVDSAHARDEVQDLALKRRDEKMAEVSEKLDAKRKQSLMELHQKERRRKQKEEGGDVVGKRRREFDRDQDLGVNRFDDAQKAAAIKKSRGVSDMFSAGSQKYL